MSDFDRYVGGALALACLGATLGMVVLMAVFGSARADDPYALSPYQGWADKQNVTARARPKFSCNPPPADCSCCHNADIVRTKFRVAEDTSDAWDWLNPQTNEWQRVPEDVIHWGEPTPDKQAVIFVNGGRVLCFFPPQEGGG